MSINGIIRELEGIASELSGYEELEDAIDDVISELYNYDPSIDITNQKEVEEMLRILDSINETVTRLNW